MNPDELSSARNALLEVAERLRQRQLMYSYFKQDACTGVHSAYRREENGHNLDICVVRRLRLTQRQMQEFLGLKWGGGGGSSFANMGFKSST